MDKKALRAEIRRQKAAMTPAQIQGCSRELTRMALASPLYEAARSIYGYLPYNQEVHTLELLQAALNSGKRVAVPKVLRHSGTSGRRSGGGRSPRPGPDARAGL